MILSHFSETPIDSLLQIQYPETNDLGIYSKPCGLWLSDESDYGWKEWCKDENFYLENLAHETKFKVDMNGVLLLDTIAKINKFAKKYTNENGSIDWATVKKDYGGVIITPYQHKLRFSSWYYSWDCASGCVWDLTKLKIIK